MSGIPEESRLLPSLCLVSNRNFLDVFSSFDSPDSSETSLNAYFVL